ncbi:MAG: S41 family peptidase [Erysipelotrichaceae bacterium]
MEEQKKTVVYKLERHLWPDEVAAKKKRRRKQIFLIAGAAVLFLSGILLGSNLGPGPAQSTFGKLDAIHEILKERWYFGKDFEDLDQKLIDFGINGMVEGGGDIHTSYMDAQTAQQFTSSLSGSFVGIGVQFYDLDGSFIIEKVFKDSPAEQNEVIAGDIIETVNGTSVQGLTSSELAAMVKGESGTDVIIGFRRGKELLTKTITRSPVLSSVYGYTENGVGIIEMNQFASTSAKEMKAYLEEFKQAGVNKLILDLRDNGGGYLETCVDIASMLLGPNKVVFEQHVKDGNVTEYTTKKSDVYSFEDFVILVNENSASASEVLTAALAEHLDVTIIGTNTYGKGTMQTSIPFADGSMLKYTIAEWRAPGGKVINGVGIAPNIEVRLDDAMYTFMPAEFEDLYDVDQVGEPVAIMQTYLNFLGYSVDRMDGYYSSQTAQAYLQYRKDNNLSQTTRLSYPELRELFSTVSRYWHFNKDQLDLQRIKAYEVLNGN